MSSGAVSVVVVVVVVVVSVPSPDPHATSPMTRASTQESEVLMPRGYTHPQTPDSSRSASRIRIVFDGERQRQRPRKSVVARWTYGQSPVILTALAANVAPS